MARLLVFSSGAQCSPANPRDRGGQNSLLSRGHAFGSRIQSLVSRRVYVAVCVITPGAAREYVVSSSISGGISGPAWLIVYGLVVLAVLFHVILTRQRLAAGATSATAQDVDGQPYAVAYLNGGPQRALMAALGSMRVAGTIVAQGQEVRAEGELRVDAPGLERAIHRSAATPIR